MHLSRMPEFVGLDTTGRLCALNRSSTRCPKVGFGKTGKRERVYVDVMTSGGFHLIRYLIPLSLSHLLRRYVDLSSTTQPRRTVVPAHKILWDEYDRRKVCISPRMLHASLTSCKLIAKPCRWQCMEKSFAAPLSLANIPWPPDISGGSDAT